jgi:hypothetical protein
MRANYTIRKPGAVEEGVSRLDADMVELSLLLPGRQLAQLETAARSQGLTTGQMLRRLITAFLHEPA